MHCSRCKEAHVSVFVCAWSTVEVVGSYQEPGTSTRVILAYHRCFLAEQRMLLQCPKTGRSCSPWSQPCMCNHRCACSTDLLRNVVNACGQHMLWLQVMKYLFSGQPRLREACNHLLRAQPGQVTADQLLDDMITQVHSPHAMYAEYVTY